MQKRSFKDGSNLHIYLTLHLPQTFTMDWNQYSLLDILGGLRCVISTLELFDPRNKTIIICDRDLESILGMKALHVSELKEAVVPHLENISTKSPPILKETTPDFDPNALYRVTKEFLEVLHTLPGIDVEKKVYTYHQLTKLLGSYILENKDQYFDSRNIRICFIKGTPLEKAFNSAFL